jgi:hypothetical protein
MKWIVAFPIRDEPGSQHFSMTACRSGTSPIISPLLGLSEEEKKLLLC